MLAGFLALVFAGTVLLALPVSSRTADPLDPVDALFTATSAVCVTGLTTVSVTADLSGFGQIVVLALIQLGAFGISVLSIALLVAAGRATLHSHVAAQEQLAAVRVRPLRLVLWVVGLTALIEVLGAIALVPTLGEGEGIWPAVFHSVSAFCNAGFSLYPDSLERFAERPAVLRIIAVLIALGGLGFLVLRELTLWLARLCRGGRPRLFLHSRTVLWASLGLWVAGAGAFALLEWQASLSGMPLVPRLDAAVFQSVTARTAGFNSLDTSSLRDITLFGTMVLMFVGGAPGGVAGGVKMTTVVVILAALRSWLRGSTTVWLFDRTIPSHVVRRAYQLVVFSMMFVGVMVAVLLASQEHLNELPDYSMAIAFETVSAFGTVGLTTGVTPELTSFGKVALVLTMLVGRIGPLVFAVTVFRPRPAPPFEYPVEELATG